MSIVVSDASPVHYLILIGAVDVLPNLFSKVVIPKYILAEELQNSKTPHPIRDWIRKLPNWVEIRKPSHPEALGLQRGEEDAISLALELNAPVLLDEREARQVAEQKGLIVVGTVGIIERAAKKNLLDIQEAFAGLKKTNFRVSESLVDEAIRRHFRTMPPQT
jgi:predicted nucleic acid-binding protein